MKLASDVAIGNCFYNRLRNRLSYKCIIVKMHGEVAKIQSQFSYLQHQLSLSTRSLQEPTLESIFKIMAT